MKSFLLGICFFTGAIMPGLAQRVCGTTEYKQQLLKADPSLGSIFKTIEKQTVAAMNQTNGSILNRDTTANEIIYIPIVVHILYKNAGENISDAQVKSQIDVLNKDFRMLNADRVNTPAAFRSLAGDARIQFCLAQVDPQGKRTSGIDRKTTSQDLFLADDAMKMVEKGGVAAWDSKRYLNIWVCRLSNRSLGYATPPGAAADRDGVVLAYDVFGTTGNVRAVFDKGRTATHEIGHWLGLIHIWGDENCGDDHVDDTPTQFSYNYGCVAFPHISTCSPNGDGDMFMNFMDFSDDACMNMFTKGQVKRMRALFAQGNLRNAFLASFACDSTLAQGGPLPEPEVVPAAVSLSATKVYPSPVLSTTTIECKAATALTVKTAVIYNSLGVKVYTAQLSQEKTTLNLSGLVSGFYFVQVTDATDKFTTRIFKQ